MKLLDCINNYDIILASKSPRRQYLLENLGLKFSVMTRETDEYYPDDLKKEQIPVYLCEQKARAFEKEIFKPDTILITADTIVWLKDHILKKPSGFNEAVDTLKSLSGKKHQVITGVCLRSASKQYSFYVNTDVYFKELNIEEIEYYVKHFRPYDKAGGYGVQEWIGYIGIERIDGSFYNVMGLPVKALYEELLKF